MRLDGLRAGFDSASHATAMPLQRGDGGVGRCVELWGVVSYHHDYDLRAGSQHVASSPRATNEGETQWRGMLA